MRDATAHATLGEVSTVQTGPFGSQLHASDYANEGTPIITVEHISDGRISRQGVPLVPTSDRDRLARYLLREGDIVFSRVGAIDRSAYVGPCEDGWLFSGRLLRVRPDPEHAVGRYLARLLGHHSAQAWIRRHAVGSTMPCLNTTILSSTPVRLPVIPEQRRIAQILDTLDDAIRAAEQVIAKLEQMRQGLLHDLLTRGIDEGGEVRDPQRHPGEFQSTALGSLPREWTVEPLGSRFDVDLGKMLSPKARTGRDPRPYVGNRAVQWNRVVLSELEFMDFSGSEREHFRLQSGDLLVCEGGEVGRAALWRGELPECYFQKAIHRLRSKGGYRAELLLRVLMRATQMGWLRQFTSQSSIAHLTQEKLVLVPIPVPTEGEQDRIVAALDEIDQRVANEVGTGTKLRALRSGLSDDLLTGRVRVKASGGGRA